MRNHHAVASLYVALRPHVQGVIPQSQPPSLDALLKTMPPELIGVQHLSWNPSAVPIDIPIVPPPPVDPVVIPVELEGVAEVGSVAEVIDAVIAIFGG